MRALIFPALLMLGLPLAAQMPEIYSSLPTYPPKSKIDQSHSGPKPNTELKENSPSRATFRMTEKYPAKLEVLVRVPCGQRVSRDELIQLAQDSDIKKQNRVVTLGSVSNSNVDLWVVATTRVWERTLKLRGRQGKYGIETNNIKDQQKWHVTQLRNPKTSQTCIDEAKLSRSDLWYITQSGLVRIQQKHRKPSS